MTEMTTESLADHWSREGYIVVRGIFDTDLVSRLKPICESTLDQWLVENPEKGEPGNGRDAHVMRHLNHPGYNDPVPGGPTAILEAASHPSVLETVEEILAEPPLFRCTSFYFNPSETSLDGNWHRDSQFRSNSDEEEKKLMEVRAHPAKGVQMQVALEPSDDIEFVPRSHVRWDTDEEYHIRKADDFANNRSNDMPGAVRIPLEPGDALAFNPLGLHRGRYHTDKRRRTIMLTYAAASSTSFDYFTDQPWFLSDGYLDGLSPAAVDFYNAYIAAYGEDWKTRSDARPYPPK
jgi:ectoine hydroxylase-related dioxygenase (phytanoyl-CoA dioxygenase family)